MRLAASSSRPWPDPTLGGRPNRGRYALSWAWWLPLALGDRLVERGDGWSTHIPGLLGPMLAAAIVLSWTEGGAGLRSWLSATTRWPRQRRWQLASLAPYAIRRGLLEA
jgi:uncharacterized protein